MNLMASITREQRPESKSSDPGRIRCTYLYKPVNLRSEVINGRKRTLILQSKEFQLSAEIALLRVE